MSDLTEGGGGAHQLEMEKKNLDRRGESRRDGGPGGKMVREGRRDESLPFSEETCTS